MLRIVLFILIFTFLLTLIWILYVCVFSTNCHDISKMETKAAKYLIPLYAVSSIIFAYSTLKLW